MIACFLVDRTIVDLSASKKVMSSFICTKLGPGNPTPVRMSMSLAHKNVKHPKGVVEDILIKVKELVFLVDFVILDMEEDVGIPLILESLLFV